MAESLSQTDFARNWLAQFSELEAPAAALLADAVMLVGYDVLYRGLRLLLDETALNREECDQDRPIALFAERAMETLDTKHGDDSFVSHDVLPYFPGTDVGRATGPGIPPIVVNPADQEVGSEGPISNFITGYERLNRNHVLSHPGPDEMRSRRVSHIVIVTDFIGSGKRVWEMLEAFWRVATVRSWHSYGIVHFAVVAYSGTEDGLKHVRSHQSKPNVRLIQACPTIFTTFVGAERESVEALCKDHPKKNRYPLGFGGAGALIAFSHGMPNNAPPILHSDRKGWIPLFRNRSALGADTHFPASNADNLADRARKVLQIRTAERFLSNPTRRRWVETMLVLTALMEGSRTAASASAHTRLPVADVEKILVFTRIAHWTSPSNAVTILGQRELRRLQFRRARTVVLPTEDFPYYYPSQLRAR